MRFITILLIATAATHLTCTSKADDLKDMLKRLKDEQEAFRAGARKEVDDFRSKVNAEYAKNLRNPWIEFPQNDRISIPLPTEPPHPPVIDEDDISPISPRPILIDTIVPCPPPVPQPTPVQPIIPDPTPLFPKVEFVFYGTPISISGADLKNFRILSSDENSLAQGWKSLASNENDNFIADCLDKRHQLELPDWGYFKLVDLAVQTYVPQGSDTHTFITGYVLAQSGYKIRFCRTEDDRLHIYFAYDGIMYNRCSLTIDGDNYYCYDDCEPGKIYASQIGMPGEKNFSMGIQHSPRLAYSKGNSRTIIVNKHPDLILSCTPNKNLIDFFNDYPPGTLDNSHYSKWAIHGNTPISQQLSESLYPTLKRAVNGLSQSEAVNLLLKVAQSFEYGLDDDIWGDDRPFWTEESWHYPYSDCEDHAIHFTRLVRDILNLDAVLVYYPGHLAAAIAFTQATPTGDYVVHEGKKYIVCDPTYFYAPAGATAPGMDNKSAILITLAP